jgi:hypothetical protein
MKNITKILNLAAIMLIMAGMVCACGKDEIEFQEYSLTEHCYWKNDSDSNPVLIIRTDEELDNHTVCYYGAIAPDVDFEKKSLVCAIGNSSYHITNVSKRIVQNSGNKYTLEVNVYLSKLNEADGWSVALLVPKLPANAEFKLVERHLLKK